MPTAARSATSTGSVDCVIWDWNGTLLDDLWLALEVANGMLARRALPTMDRDRYREIFDFPVEQYYRRAGFDFEHEPFSALAREFIDGYNARVGECGLQPAAHDTLERFAGAGVPQYVLSASRQSSLEEAISAAGIAEYFERLSGLSDHYAVSKRSAGAALVETIPVAAHRAVLVGDTVHDAEVAEAMGVPCVLIAAGHQSQQRLCRAGVPVFSSLDRWIASL